MCEKGCVDTVHITGLIYRTTVHIDNFLCDSFFCSGMDKVLCNLYWCASKLRDEPVVKRSSYLSETGIFRWPTHD